MKKKLYYLLALSLLVWSQASFALKIKVGVLAPDGTTWTKNLKSMVKEIKKATDGKVNFKIYAGGVAGDEPDVLRKIRIGQMHAGIFTGRALGEINGDARVIEIPFTFYRDREKALKTLESLEKYLASGFEKKGFKQLGMFEIGLIYVVSTKKVTNLKEMKGIKVWSWEGDRLVEALVKSMGLVAVPLALPDVLSSLSTGIIQAAYASPMAVLALQWSSKVKYLINYPVSYSIGAFVVDKKVWKKIPTKYQKTVEKICRKYVDIANKSTIKDNNEAMGALVDSGVKLIEFPKEDTVKSTEIRAQVVKKLKGNLISKKAMDLLNKNL